MSNEQIQSKANYPRPDFIRKNFMPLDGEWEFSFPAGLTHHFPDDYQNRPLPDRITVPFCCSCRASGINCTDYVSEVYYARTFTVSEQPLLGEVLLKFGAVDYFCDVWVNGSHIGSHSGGHTQFEFPISSFLSPGENRIYLHVKDDRRCDRPRGKQYWKDKPDRCWYTNTIGIWKPVWLEFTQKEYISRVKLTPDTDSRSLRLEAYLNRSVSGTLTADIFFHDTFKKTVAFSFTGTHYISETISVEEEDFIDEIHYWSPDSPNLYNLCLTLSGGDAVECYFGMRKIEAMNSQVYLNNRRLFQSLILDQGYWKESLMTPPAKEALKKDIQLTKLMGFNGARKHQKLEDPHYYYWADVLGLLVWCEMPSPYQFNDCEIHSFLSEWQEMICEVYNHPCIITWVLFNESWGVRNVLTCRRQQDLIISAYYLTRAYDPTRLISTNDGWENPGQTDLFCIHDYEGEAAVIKKRYLDIEKFAGGGIPGRQAMIHSASYRGQPFFLSEYGGISLLRDSSGDNWGYNEAAKTCEEYVSRIAALTDAIHSLPDCCGCCYTQLTDVMQEVNGLLTAEREPKVPLETLHGIFSARRQ